MKGLNKFCFLSGLFVVLIGFLSAYAQVDYATATLRGTVLDPQGAVVAGATVTVTNPSRGITKTAKTGGDGTYRVAALPPGSYEISIEAQGFSREIAKGIELTVGQSQVFDARLKVGSVSETVEVSSDSVPLIQTEQTQQANTINQLQVVDLPNITRSITQAVYTLPGVGNSEAPRTQQPGFTGFHTTGFSIGGSNGRNNLSTIDGGENEYGTGQYRVATIPVEAIQEFQVNRNAFTAEFGFTTGSAINIVTKSGGNLLHGNVFGNFSNHSTTATNFFNGLQFSPFNSATNSKAYSQNLYTGVTLGGPIKKDKLFFFMAYEYQRLDIPDFTNAGVLFAPTVLGLNAPGLGTNCAAQFASKAPDQVCYLNALKASGDPFLQGFATSPLLIAGLTPLTNPALSTILHRDNGIFDNQVRRHNAIMRFDVQPSNANTVGLRLEYSHDDRSEDNRADPDGNGLFTRDFSILTNWTHNSGSALVNQVLVQIVPQNKSDNLPRAFTGVNFTLGNLSPSGLGGASSFGSPSLIPYIAHQRRYQFEDAVTWNKGAHSFKFGASYRAADYHVEDDLWFNTQFDFQDGAIPLITLAPAVVQGHLVAFNVANFGAPLALGPASTNLSAPQSFSFGIPIDVIGGSNNPKWQGWGHYFGSFAQDTWKLNSTLTMNAGVRLDFDGEPSPLGGSVYASPRLGFAWDPFGDHKTVIRAGGGIYVAPIDVLVPSYAALLDGSGRYINQVLSITSATNPSVAQLWGLGLAKGELPFGRLTQADFAAVGIGSGLVSYSIAPGYRNPYAIEASLSVDRELMKSLSLELGYNMYHSVHQQNPMETAYRQISPGSPLCPSVACTDISGGPLYVPTGQFEHTAYTSNGSSIYHGMTASLTKRYSSGLQFQVNYTWSKSIDNFIDFASFQEWFRPSRLDLFRAPSVFDIPHTFVANAVYTTPFKASQGNFVARALADITVAPVLNISSGLPFSIRTPTLATSQFGIGNGDAADSRFAMPFHSSRDNNRGAGYASTDLKFTKAFYINRDRGVRMDAIAEGTNIFNRVNFDKIADQFDINGFTSSVKLANGNTLDLINGPYTGLHGVKPHFLSDTTTPLSFAHAAPARLVQFGLKLAF
jgi:Carboxypeptidase regulatory-like domain/TonB-dependent Receptor Plug Domain